jgi:hypothetical protein
MGDFRFFAVSTIFREQATRVIFHNDTFPMAAQINEQLSQSAVV